MLGPGQRIAAKYGSELDIMKIASIGYASIAGQQVAVALVCPGQASFRVKNTGEASLNRLVDLRSLANYRAQKPWLVKNPGYAMRKEDALEGYSKAYWIPLVSTAIVPISKTEMRGLQELVRPIAPEIFRG